MFNYFPGNNPGIVVIDVYIIFVNILDLDIDLCVCWWMKVELYDQSVSAVKGSEVSS